MTVLKRLLCASNVSLREAGAWRERPEEHGYSGLADRHPILAFVLAHRTANYLNHNGCRELSAGALPVIKSHGGISAVPVDCLRCLGVSVPFIK
jgi:hypothetical protein